MAKQEVHVAGLFSTPVLTTLLPDGAKLAAELRPIILDHERTHPSVQHSNLGGWQSDTDFLSWAGPAAQCLVDCTRPLIDRLTVDRSGRPANVPWHVNAWANVNRHQHGNEFHTHAGCFWSAVFYVDDGGVAADPSLGGQLEFQDPRGIAPAMHAPYLAFASAGGLTIGTSEMVGPRSGLLVVFPSWLSHGVRPYLGQAIRISIALNFSAYPTFKPR